MRAKPIVEMGNLTSRRRARPSGQEPPRSLINDETTSDDETEKASRHSPFETVDAALAMSPPDMVAVQMHYSHNLQQLFTKDSLQTLLKNLYTVCKQLL